MQRSKNNQTAGKRQRNLLLLPLLLVLLGAAAIIILQNARLQAANQNPPQTESEQAKTGKEPATQTENQVVFETPEPTPTPTPEPVYVHTIPEDSLTGMDPDPDGYYESMNAEELAAFLQREEV